MHLGIRRRRPPVAMVAAVALLLAAPASAVAEDGPERTIRVVGTATVEATPDRARVNVVVETRGKTARAAAGDNAELADEVIEAVKSVLGKVGKVRTSGYDVRAEYEYRKDATGNRRHLVGFVARNSVIATTPKIETVGDLVDAAVEAGAGEVQGLSFYLNDPEAARRQALLEAGRKARAEAATVAESLSVELGELLEASTASHTPSPRPPMPHARMMATAADAKATPIEPGTVDLQVSVHAVFAIR